MGHAILESAIDEVLATPAHYRTFYLDRVARCKRILDAPLPPMASMSEAMGLCAQCGIPFVNPDGQACEGHDEKPEAPPPQDTGAHGSGANRMPPHDPDGLDRVEPY